jgi:alanyl-tRNA synthetase
LNNLFAKLGIIPPILIANGARMARKLTGNEIRQSFIDFFVEQQHTVVPSASLVPGGDATLLFTNSGMVQFKDVFLGTDKRPYTRAVDSQKCMRVAGKHNDLDDVGRDDWHHTFFEMLGNWSFGDYYKKEAIAWSWQLLTDVWGIPKDRLYATCFKDEKGSIPTDEDAANFWRQQPGMDPSHILYFGRKENFWEMAETGPCGPCSEIHIDRGEEFCELKGKPHNCSVNGDCQRFLELWNNVFIQYNRLDAATLEPLPETHVDTGMGFERIVAVLQGVDSNYKTDLFQGALDVLLSLTGSTREKMYADFTPYRVIADHGRAAAFLIADGVVPGNTGRNYVCRMIIRRAARFGTKIGLHEPFLAQVADAFIEQYGAFYPELEKHRQAIRDSLTREEVRFSRTVESGTAFLQGMLDEIRREGKSVLEGRRAFDLYATYGLPLEISRDIAREQGMDVDESGFRAAMDEHRIASGAGKAMGLLGGEDAEFFAGIARELQADGKLPPQGVSHDPYNDLTTTGEILALIVDGQSVQEASFGDGVEVIIPRTGFYIESGGQVSDTGYIKGPDWEIEVFDVRRPAPGLIVHMGEVISGKPRLGDTAVAEVNKSRRRDIMRNHTATHLMHAALHHVLGEHARQAGSLVAPDHLRFDFNHPEAMTAEQIEQVERLVNEAVAADFIVQPKLKAREEAIAEGAMALFGEKYGETVRTITIKEDDPEADKPHSYELCGGTHLERTSDVGAFLITSEGSAAAGIRRIEAVTGRGAYELIARRTRLLKQSAGALKSSLDEVPRKVQGLLDELADSRKQVATLRAELAKSVFNEQLQNIENVKGISVLAAEIPNADVDTLRSLADIFRDKYPQNSICVLGTSLDDKPALIAAVTEDLVKRGLKAGDLVKFAAEPMGGGGGGKPTLAQAGGKDASKLPQVLGSVKGWVESKVK